ncbi:hypothetical protein [Paracoccus denitrificans]|jgi:crotonobetainyl-CoA:carnitine CoA-transferase CaiB-like acyl-CoA transferase|uniref:hypothetical protein n=1 Tax=Paracoccus denitrificans TaxID=266 RepID=UPI00031F049D|nr:hypothetical protein [Paracoccus denitrificans]MBB4627835.1 crotonobetainyl-CoA:carnitine CoA-transferase CaiB-like acyl-CoA transferase [Paracoccus denitrificans]MCU7428630.1 hypothetical protein [Paracoccus denitrificans]UPV95338.1 hypothetical protein M0K93_01740 [Paracoccus denitrificans]WQO32603.1 hypothetical protein U0005_09700 [Paracoccus denitrificans]SDI59287.1 hypothetical protein SAMN04244581_01901 [Paracoccus denitrificans]
MIPPRFGGLQGTVVLHVSCLLAGSLVGQLPGDRGAEVFDVGAFKRDCRAARTKA